MVTCNVQYTDRSNGHAYAIQCCVRLSVCLSLRLTLLTCILGFIFIVFIV